MADPQTAPEDHSSRSPPKAPSVAVPESIIPSADASGPFNRTRLRLFPDAQSRHAVRLPESFRGGCSFGAGAQADLSRRDVVVQSRTKTGRLRTRLLNARHRSIYQRPHPVFKGFTHVGKSGLLHTFWTRRGRPVKEGEKRLRREGTGVCLAGV